MTASPITLSFPTLCSLLSNSAFEKDVEFALELASSNTLEQDLRILLEEKAFDLNDLMWGVLCTALLQHNDPGTVALESNLTAIVAAVGIDEARKAYRNKLLVNCEDTLEDARYEIAVTAQLCRILDAGSIRLEYPIPGSKNNSDVFGTLDGESIRIEVTVLHECLPPAADLDLDDVVRAATMDSGFIVNLNRVLANQDHAERVRSIIELLHESHMKAEGEYQEIDRLPFEWRGGAYHCERRESPIKTIQFDLPVETRQIIHPVFTRSTTPPHIKKDFEQPAGVTSLFDVPRNPDTHNDNPLSTKVRQMLDAKRRQCEDGVVNIVALCNPLPFHDRKVASAVYGVPMVIVPYDEDETGMRHFKETLVRRNHKAPFSPDNVMSDDEREEFLEPFRKLSGVWLFRLGIYARSQLLPNFNAARTIPDKLVDFLSVKEIATPAPLEPSECTVELAGLSNANDGVPAMADDYVTVCRSYEQARNALAELRRTGVPFSELESRLDQLKRTSDTQGQAFCEPIEEEWAISFVLECGGFPQADACLSSWAMENGIVSPVEDRRRWIEENAYFRWLNECYHHGNDVRHWYEAEIAYGEVHPEGKGAE